MLCPICDAENIEGIDICAECGFSLTAVEPPTNDVARSVASHPISALCPRAPVCVSPTDSVQAVIAKMASHGIGCVLVTEGESLAGIFSERDVLTRVSGTPARLSDPVRDVMTPRPFTIAGRDCIGYALQAMDLGGYRHLPIVDDSGRPTGMISIRDIVRFIAVYYAKSRGTV
jgi:CBS domain-containing protein